MLAKVMKAMAIAYVLYYSTIQRRMLKYWNR